jgi:uncharacterized protein (TIGR02611 family)
VSERRLRHKQRSTLVRIGFAVAAFLLLGVGLLLLVLPGPGLPLIIAALAMLALEFAWADRLLRHARRRVARARSATPVAQALGVAALLAAGVAAAAAALLWDVPLLPV